MPLREVDWQGIKMGLRPYGEGPKDRAFILSSWVRTGVDNAGIPKRTFLTEHPLAIDRALAHEKTRTVVACSPEEPTAIHGWAVTAPPGVILWAYVAEPMRGFGLARMLIKEALGDYPERIWVGYRFAPIYQKSGRYEFNPYAWGR